MHVSEYLIRSCCRSTITRSLCYHRQAQRSIVHRVRRPWIVSQRAENSLSRRKQRLYRHQMKLVWTADACERSQSWPCTVTCSQLIYRHGGTKTARAVVQHVVSAWRCSRVWQATALGIASCNKRQSVSNFVRSIVALVPLRNHELWGHYKSAKSAAHAWPCATQFSGLSAGFSDSLPCSKMVHRC